MLLARPLVIDDPEKLSYILDKLSEHRPWFDDHDWDDVARRRAVASNYMAAAIVNGKVFEVWDGKSLTGLILLDNFQLRAIECHFIFFDRNLKDKVQLCVSVMDWLYQQAPLVEMLRVRVPTYAKALARFIRKKLGFRYEAEARPLAWPQNARPLTAREAELGSRIHRATLYKGRWHDQLLLSISREEFHEHWRRDTSGQGSWTATADTPSQPTTSAVPAESAGDQRPVPTD